MEAIRRKIEEAFERARQHNEVMPEREPEIEVIPQVVVSAPVNRATYSHKPISWGLASIHEIPDTPPVPVERLYKDALKSLGF